MGLSLKGKVALVTGAGTSAHSAHSVGIGRAISIKLAQAGASVVLVDKDEANARDTLRAVDAEGGQGSHFVGDVTSAAACEAMVAAAVDRYGGLDILINNAAVSKHAAIVETSTELYDLILGVNLKGTFQGCKAAIPALIARGGGSIVNIGSVAGIRDVGSSHPAYSASKAAVLGLMIDLAGEYGLDNIRVNTILPGMVRSPMQETIGAITEEMQKRMNLLGRTGSGWDIADAVLFLCSDMASYITGVTLPIDGGATIGMITSAGRFAKRSSSVT